MIRQSGARLAVLLAAGVWGLGTFNIAQAAEDAPKAEAAESVTFGSGDRISGHILSIGADGIARMTAPGMEGEAALRVAALQRAEFTPAAKETDPHFVLLTNGDCVAGTVSAVTSAQLIIESSAAGKLTLDRSLVKAVRLTADAAPDADASHEIVLLANKDKMPVGGLTLTDGQLNVKGDFGELSLSLPKVAAITFRTSDLKTAAADPKSVRVQMERTKLTLDSVETMDEKALTGRAASLGGSVRIERAALKWVVFSKGASKAEAGESVALRSGDRISGQILSIGADGSLRMIAPCMEGPTALRVAALHRAEFAPTAKEADPHLVLLTNGDCVAGTVSAITAAQVVIESSAASVPLRGSERGGKLAIDRPWVKAVRFTAGAALRADATHETVFLVNNDKMAVDGLTLADGKLNVKGEFGELPISLAKVSGIAFRASALKTATADPKAVRALTGRTALTLDSVELMDDKALTGRAASFGGAVRIERAALKEIVFGPADPLRFNSDAPLTVYYRPNTDPLLVHGEWKILGSTPAAAPLTIPEGCEWLVGPTDGHTMSRAVVEEMLHRAMPGLKLVMAADSDLTSLKELPDLQALNLDRCMHVTDAGLAMLKGLTSLQSLDLSYTRVTDAGLANLKELKGLRALHLFGTGVTDAGLVNLKDLTHLQTLDLAACAMVTDAGLANLKEMKDLQALYLNQARLSDTGLADLKGLTSLQTLDLYKTDVTDDGLANLKELTNLRTLDLGACFCAGGQGLAPLKELTNLQTLSLEVTSVTDAGLAVLKQMTELQSLNLRGCGGVTDAGLANLKELIGLRKLDLSCINVTDAGLANLKEMTHLRTLNLRNTQVTDTGVNDLKAALPNIQIAK